VRGVLDTTLCDKVCQLLAAGQWFSPATYFSSTNKTDRHNITEILLKVALNTIILIEKLVSVGLPKTHKFTPFIQTCNEDQRLILTSITAHSLNNLPILVLSFSPYLICFYFVELYAQKDPLTVILYHYGQL